MMNMPFDLKNIDLKDRRTQQLLAILLVSAAGFVLYVYFVVMPQFVRVTTLISKVRSMKTEMKTAKSTIAEMSGLKKKLGEYKEKVEMYEKKLPAEQEIPSLLENLSNMAKVANIKITSIMPVMAENKIAQPNQLYREIPIRITAKSGFHELGRFLNDLENGDRFMKIVEIGIKTNKTSPKLHEIDLKVCTYILLLEK